MKEHIQSVDAYIRENWENMLAQVVEILDINYGSAQVIVHDGAL